MRMAGTQLGSGPEHVVAALLDAAEAVAGDPMTGTRDAAQLPGVDVQQIARRFVLVSHDRLNRIQVCELGKSGARQNPSGQFLETPRSAAIWAWVSRLRRSPVIASAFSRCHHRGLAPALQRRTSPFQPGVLDASPQAELLAPRKCKDRYWNRRGRAAVAARRYFA